MADLQTFLIFAAFSANFFEQSEAQRNSKVISAPFFDDGDNLSFRNCGKWNRSVSRDYAPWSARIAYGSSYWLHGTIISRRTIILDDDKIYSDDIRRNIKNGGTSAKIGFCRDKSNCRVDKNEGFVTKVVDYVEYIGVNNVTLYITEKMPEFTEFYSPICLFNRGSEVDFQQTANFYKIWNYQWYKSTQAKIEPIERCLNEKTITRMQNEEPNKLQWLICVYQSLYEYLTYYDEGRFFLRGRGAYGFNYMHGYNRSTHFLYYDFLFLTHWIVQNSPDISVLPEIPLTPPTKKFKGVQNLSFPNCGETRKIQSRQKREDEPEKPVPLIHHGKNALIGDHPWHSEIQIPKISGSCGGTLITKRAVLTAAHCLANVTASEIEVTLGIKDKTQRNQGQTQIPSQLIIHKNYNSQTYENDLALMIFSQDFKLNGNVLPICIWNEDLALDRIVGKYAMAVGWGLDENFTLPNILQKTNLPIISHKKCYLGNRPFFGKYLKPGKSFCAGYTNGTTVCRGDSGGGLSIEKGGRWFIRGIVSFSRSQKRFNEYGEEEVNCHPESYSVFTDVGGYMDWIVENTPDISYEGDKDVKILAKSKPDCGWWKKNFGKLFGSPC